MITPKFRRSNRCRHSPHSQNYDGNDSDSNIFSSVNFGSSFFPPRSNTSFLNTTIDQSTIEDAIHENVNETLKVANFNLRRALGVLKLNDSYHKLEFIESFIFSSWFKSVGYVLTTLQCALCYVEPVSVMKSNTEMTESIDSINSIRVISIMELCILMFHGMPITAQIYRRETIRNVPWIWWIMTVLLLLALLSVFISLWWSSWLRFHRMIRPLFFNLYWMQGLWCFEIITMTLIRILQPLFLALCSITIFSAVVYSMFCPHSLCIHGDPAMRELYENGLPQFSSFGRTWVEMFVLQTTR